MHNTISQDLKKAMLAHDVTAVSTLRMLLSELKYAEVAKGSELSESEAVSVVQKEIKKRKEASESFRKGGREEQAGKEDQEAKVLENYLPQQLADEELTKVVMDAINKLGASTMADMGKVIAEVRSQVGQSADGSRISLLVREKLISKVNP